jgi:chromosome condensin MukBEF complex kleisin-like MukF subunit
MRVNNNVAPLERQRLNRMHCNRTYNIDVEIITRCSKRARLDFTYHIRNSLSAYPNHHYFQLAKFGLHFTLCKYPSRTFKHSPQRRNLS